MPCSLVLLTNQKFTAMTQVLSSRSENCYGQVLCCYVNSTSHIQVVRIVNIPAWHFERVVFPGQRLLFEASPQGQLEIYTGSMASAILSDKISCENLRIVGL